MRAHVVAYVAHVSRVSFDDDETHPIINFFTRYVVIVPLRASELIAIHDSHWFFTLSLLAGLYVLARSFDAVLFIRVATKMHNYTWFLSQILFRMHITLGCVLLANRFSAICFIFVTWPIVIYRYVL